MANEAVMRWPWSSRGKIDSEQAKQALQEAHEERAKVEAQQERVDDAAKQLDDFRRANHFSNLVEQAMRVRRGSS